MPMKTRIRRLITVALCAFAPAASFASSDRVMFHAPGNAPSGAIDLCERYVWACARSEEGVSYKEDLRLLKKINRSVNRKVSSVGDNVQYDTDEYWALPTARGGDCEDYALLKKKELIEAGFDPQKLLISTATSPRTGGHAVLIYRSQEGDLILDNLTNQVKLWTKARLFLIKAQDPDDPTSWHDVYKKTS